jgi:UPF0716 family protein affecting phage T7 exclusion
MFTLLLATAQSTPDADKVVAGWLGAVVLLGLAIATALLLWSFTRQLKKAKAAQASGAYGDAPASEDTAPEA